MNPAVDDVVRSTQEFLLDNCFAGIDPYDALTSALIRKTIGRSRWGRIIATQVLRRMPVNPRGILGIAPQVNSKTVAQYILGSMALWRSARRVNVDGMRAAVEWAVTYGKTSNGMTGWGYYFDWQSRAFFLPAGTPTIVNTSFMAHALLDYWAGMSEAPDEALLRAMLSIYSRGFRRTEFGDVFCFGYSPTDTSLVHNANLLGASAYMRIASLLGDEAACADASRAAAFTIRRQRPDGSWPYGETDIQLWIDSFHTGFNLYALDRLLASRHCEEADLTLKRGMEYFRHAFFDENGSVQYYNNRATPRDAHCPATCIGVLARLGDLEMASKVASWTVEKFRGDDGLFDYRWGSHGYRNRIRYVRWVQAWMFWGFCELSSAHEKTGTDRVK